jgi:hypothetical protein
MGSEPSAAARMLVRAAVRSALILEAIDAYVLALAQTDALVNRRSRKA